MVELAIFTLNLRPLHEAILPGWLGRSAQAWFLDSLRAVSPDLSAAVHDGSRPRPFTLSSLLPTSARGSLMLSPRRVNTLRLTTLHPDLTQLTQNALIPHWLQHGIVLHSQPLRVESVQAHTLRYADLLAAPAAGRRQRLTFASPTLFSRTGSLPVPLPLPEYVFGSLLDRWQAFSSLALHPDLRQFVQQHIGIEAFEGHTQTVSLERAARGSHTGFTGSATFSAHNAQGPCFAHWHALGLYAAFSGVGKHTTIGLGQVAPAPHLMPDTQGDA